MQERKSPGFLEIMGIWIWGLVKSQRRAFPEPLGFSPCPNEENSPLTARSAPLPHALQHLLRNGSYSIFHCHLQLIFFPGQPPKSSCFLINSNRTLKSRGINFSPPGPTAYFRHGAYPASTARLKRWRYFSRNSWNVDVYVEVSITRGERALCEDIRWENSPREHTTHGKWSNVSCDQPIY